VLELHRKGGCNFCIFKKTLPKCYNFH